MRASASAPRFSLWPSSRQASERHTEARPRPKQQLAAWWSRCGRPATDVHPRTAAAASGRPGAVVPAGPGTCVAGGGARGLRQDGGARAIARALPAGRGRPPAAGGHVPFRFGAATRAAGRYELPSDHAHRADRRPVRNVRPRRRARSAPGARGPRTCRRSFGQACPTPVARRRGGPWCWFFAEPVSAPVRAAYLAGVR